MDENEIKERYIAAEPLIQMGYMVAGVAHEIKNPLNILQNYLSLDVELLLEMKQDPSASDILQTLIENHKIMQNQWERIFLIAQGILHTTAQKEEGIESVSLKKLMETYVMLAYHTWRAMDHNFNVTFEWDVPKDSMAHVYAFHLGRGILNIADNALFTLHEKWKSDVHFNPILKLSLHHEGSVWNIVIEDNGMGMDKNVKMRLFEPFMSTKKGNTGTGLGLFLTKQIIEERHRGKINIESTWTQGTTVTFKIPDDLDKIDTLAKDT